jgi:hypothetical protein
MTRTIRLQSDSNAHDRPWRVAVEQGYFKDEGLNVEYYEDNPKGAAGRVEKFADRWKESKLSGGELEVYPVCEWGAIERVQQLGHGRIIGLDTTARTGAIMVRKDSKITSLAQLRNVPIAVTWHAGTFYAAIEALEAAGVPYGEIKLVHANDRLKALLDGGHSPGNPPRGIGGGTHVCDQWRAHCRATARGRDNRELMRALIRRLPGCRQNEDRRREQLLRDSRPNGARRDAELIGAAL